MKSREMFRLALKIIGFIILLQGFRCGVDGLLILKGYATVRLSTPQYWAAWAIIKMVAGVYLMIGGTPLVNLAFSLKTAATQDASKATTAAGAADAEGGNGGFMDPRVIFGLAVKTVGLILVLYGLEYFFDALLYAMKTAESKGTSGHNSVLGIAAILLGLGMLRGTVPLVDFAFPKATSTGQPKVEKAAEQDRKDEA